MLTLNNVIFESDKMILAGSTLSLHRRSVNSVFKLAESKPSKTFEKNAFPLKEKKKKRNEQVTI